MIVTLQKDNIVVIGIVKKDRMERSMGNFLFDKLESTFQIVQANVSTTLL